MPDLAPLNPRGALSALPDSSPPCEAASLPETCCLLTDLTAALPGVSSLLTSIAETSHTHPVVIPTACGLTLMAFQFRAAASMLNCSSVEPMSVKSL